MTFKLNMAAAAVAVAMVVGSGTAVFAKAHDNGVADGPPPLAGTTKATDEALRGLGSNGVSLLTNGKAGILGDGTPLPGFNTSRGETASSNKDDNRVVPD